LIGTPSTITRVLMVVLVPKPRILTGWAVGWSWPVGMLGSQTPGTRLTIWSTPVSGSAWICSRDSTVVLTSSLSRAEPRPALTVMGGRLTGGGVSCAPANDGINAAPANAASIAARTENMNKLPK
jgi:hypothetical protein